VVTSTPFSSRLRSDQKAEVREVRELRKQATDLRSNVSHGSNGDEELELFWKLIGSAGLVLQVSSPQLGQRAGLGDSFFLSVARDHRRPKLTNFLKALTVIVEIADELLFEMDNAEKVSGRESRLGPPVRNVRIEQDHKELFLLASSLSRLAQNEIARLNDERPNDPFTIEEHKRQRELLTIFESGFERIAVALEMFESNVKDPLLLGSADDVVKSVGNQIITWWKQNGTKAIDWSVRIPTFAAGVAMLGWAGANMTVATSAVAAIVGGDKVIKSFRNKNKVKCGQIGCRGTGTGNLTVIS